MLDAVNLVGLVANRSCCQNCYNILGILGILGILSLKQAYPRTGASQTNFSLIQSWWFEGKAFLWLTHFASALYVRAAPHGHPTPDLSQHIPTSVGGGIPTWDD
jgi:hypothetical protein